jgi:hypothetical protein
MQSIIIDIDVDGNTKVSVKGVKGSSCKDLTKKIEAALGKVTRDDKTPEFHQQVAASARVQQ